MQTRSDRFALSTNFKRDNESPNGNQWGGCMAEIMDTAFLACKMSRASAHTWQQWHQNRPHAQSRSCVSFGYPQGSDRKFERMMLFSWYWIYTTTPLILQIVWTVVARLEPDWRPPCTQCFNSRVAFRYMTFRYDSNSTYLYTYICVCMRIRLVYIHSIYNIYDITICMCIYTYMYMYLSIYIYQQGSRVKTPPDLTLGLPERHSPYCRGLP